MGERVSIEEVLRTLGHANEIEFQLSNIFNKLIADSLSALMSFCYSVGNFYSYIYNIIELKIK